jgi:threonine dehydrogenase-like Zn-dependent dehydrogenase
VVDAASGADPTPLELAINLTRDGGSIIVQNAYHPEVVLTRPLRDLFRRSIRLIGSFSHCRRIHSDFELALDLLLNTEAAARLVTLAGNIAALPIALSDETRYSSRLVLQQPVRNSPRL